MKHYALQPARRPNSAGVRPASAPGDLAVITAVSVPQATQSMLDTINRTLSRDVAIQLPLDAVGSKLVPQAVDPRVHGARTATPTTFSKN